MKIKRAFIWVSASTLGAWRSAEVSPAGFRCRSARDLTDPRVSGEGSEPSISRCKRVPGHIPYQAIVWHRGTLVGCLFTFSCAAYNLLRMRNLMAAEELRPQCLRQR